ncbi:MAG TPA: OmpA family protein [Spongiibacteraceae bacterium]|nr:OmpA family protein [Spongiibacteraceae bacterium]
MIRAPKCAALSLAILAATAALNLEAQPSAGMVFINPAAQYIYYGRDRAVDTYDLTDKLGWQFGVEYLITDHFGLEAVYSEQKPNIDSDPASHFIDVKDRRWRLDGLWYFPVAGKFVPYIAGGAGEGRFQYEVDPSYVGTAGFDDHHDRETQLNLGGGVRYFLTDHISLRADIRAVRSLDEDTTDAVGSLGISYNFGGRKPAPEPVAYQAPPEPAPAPPPEPAPVYEKMKLSSEAMFDFDKATVRPSARQALDEMANKLTHYPKQIESIKVYGHTDRLGAADYNQRLSTERAEAVKDYLVAHGVPARQIQAEGKGSTQPETNPDDCKGTKRSKALIECLQPDRRVEVDVTIERQVNK